MRLTIRRCAVCFIAGLLVTPSISAARQDGDLQKRLQVRVDELVEKGGFPGLTAAIALPDGQVLTAAAGWADPQHKTPMKPNHRMLAGSVGKTFVAAAILQGVDDGALDLDAKIERWLAREPWFQRLPNARTLTLRLLLSHRSGLRDHTDDEQFRKAITTQLSKRWTPQELIQWELDKKPAFAAGAKYSYSDMNYIVAGLVFETATGRKLFDEVSRRIVKPLGLDQTAPTETDLLENVVPGELDPRTLKIAGFSIRDGHLVYNAQAEYAGGGMISTSRDLARWAKLLWEGKVFSRAMLDQMLDAKPSEQGLKYGLGVEVAQSEAGPVYMHDGWIPGYLSAMIYFPNYKIAAAIQINADPLKRFKVPPDSCIGRIAGVVLKDLMPKKTPK